MKPTLSIIALFLVFQLLLSCGTTQHDREWMDEQDRYKKECQDWYRKVGKKKFERKPGEEAWSVQAVAVARCKEDPSLCEPPRKPAKLKYHEHYWGQPETMDYCGSFPNDFRDDRFDEE